MTEQVPLYLGIPLAGLCIAAIVFATVLAITIWKDRS